MIIKAKRIHIHVIEGKSVTSLGLMSFDCAKQLLDSMLDEGSEWVAGILKAA